MVGEDGTMPSQLSQSSQSNLKYRPHRAQRANTTGTVEEYDEIGDVAPSEQWLQSTGTPSSPSTVPRATSGPCAPGEQIESSSAAIDQPKLDRKSKTESNWRENSNQGGRKTMSQRSFSEDLSHQVTSLWRNLAQRHSFLNFKRTSPRKCNKRLPGIGHAGETPKAEESVKRCKDMCNNLGKVTSEELEEEFEDLLHYKNRMVKGRLLHFAVFECFQKGDDNATLVRRVLDAQADVNGKASYKRDGGQENLLEAVHIAAGLGHVPCLRALAEKAPDPVLLLNTYCHVMEHNEPEEFYTPLHDAAYQGRKDAVVWLLENRAEASKLNRDGYTPLHWLATVGLEPEADLEVVVKALIKHKASLATKSKMIKDKGGKIPLELAAADDSYFPRRLLHLLAPSFQPVQEENSTYSFFDDMCVLSSLNMAAADQLARELLESDDPGCHSRVYADAQKVNAVDRMANLFQMAPQAAADMLQILMVKPKVEDPGRHPIRSRASLWGLFYSMTMRCEYQADSVRRSSASKDCSLKWPVWKFDSTKKDDKDDKFLTDQPGLAWHLSLVKTPDDSEERREYVDDVDTKVVLLPNILDIDIFMALASTGHSHKRIFASLPVQGIIYCLWDHLIVPAVLMRLALTGFDVAVQAYWGLSNVVLDGEDNTKVDTNSPLHCPVSWSIVMAGLLRDVVNTVWWFCAFYHKWKGHFSNFQKWQESRPEAEMRPPSLHALWRPQAFFTCGFLCWEVPMVLAKVWFLWDVRHLGHGSDNAAMSDVQQALLTANAVLQFFRVIYMLRLTNCCRRVTTILSAFVSGAIREMFVVTSLFFGAVVLAFSMLKRSSSTTWLATGLFLYRGIFLNDGDSLDELGLDPKKLEEGVIRTALMLVATLVFNIVILNLTVAVYSSEYDRLERESEVYLQRERAKTCCELLLSAQKIHLRSQDDRWLLWVGQFLCAVALAVGVFLLFFASREGYSSITTRCFIAACLFAFAQVTFQAVHMASDWFPERDNGEEGPQTEHFLWICHRSVFSEENFNSEELDKKVIQGVVDERIQKLDQKVEGHVSRLNQRLDDLDNNVLSVNSKLEEVVSLVKRVAENTVTSLPPTASHNEG